ncbi:DUF6234 family protein [Streptomyces sp. NPDC046931]|uniref:DUF6234 family protein n=1 Tax=Streptomyces sp. NPDC046931 TaxID=3154806 RepID=UPI00340A5245
MNLPIGPPAFDATTGSRRRHRADTGADIGAGCGLLLLELAALVVIFGLWFLSGFNLDPARTVETDSLWSYLAAAGGVGALAVLAVVIAARAGALVTVISQGVMVALVSLIVLGGAMVQEHEDARVSTGGNACHAAPSAPWCNG